MALRMSGSACLKGRAAVAAAKETSHIGLNWIDWMRDIGENQ